MLSSSLDKATRVILNRWALEGFYIYLRPVSSRLVEGAASKKKEKTYWVVTVEFRTVPPGQWRGEGYNLDEVITELATLLPRNRAHRAVKCPHVLVGGAQCERVVDHPGPHGPVAAGRMAPKAAFEREKAAFRKTAEAKPKKSKKKKRAKQS